MAKTKKQITREGRREEMINYLKERGKTQYVFDLIEKLEDPSQELDALMIQRYRAALDTRVKLMAKYMPDLKSVEMEAKVSVSSADDWVEDDS